MIRPPQQHLALWPKAVSEAITLVDSSSATSKINAWIDEDRPRGTTGGAEVASAALAYPVRACLVGLLLLLMTRQPVSWTALLQLFWVQTSRADLERLGLGQTVTEERQARLTQGPAWTISQQRIWESEYQRLAKCLDIAFGTVRWSPHDRKKKRRNAELKAKVSSLDDATAANLSKRKRRHDDLINDLIAASIDRDLLAPHGGDVMFDEVVVQVANASGDTGTRDDKRHTGNPDAGWWQKGKKDKPRWAHGVTLVMATHRPDERKVPAVVIGMSLGKPTGGDVSEVLIALDHAHRNGLTKTPSSARDKSRLAIADMGFTHLRGMNKALIDRRYYVVQDYHAKASRKHRVSNGAVLFNGVIICPGFEPATRTDFEWLPDNATASMQRRHADRERVLTAGRMHPNGRPVSIKREGRGRPRAGETPPDLMRLEVSCPAASGQCRCPAVPSSELLPLDQVPTVITPPDGSNPPLACQNTFSRVALTPGQVKQYGLHLYGSGAQKRLYKHVRSLNEQWHSQLRSQHTGGIDGNVFATEASERIAVIVALAVAWTNIARQRSFVRLAGTAQPASNTGQRHQTN